MIAETGLAAVVKSLADSRGENMKGVVLVETNSLIHVRERCIEVVPLNGEGERHVSYPPEDMGVLMVEGIHSRISASALAMLADAKAVVCVCDARKLPVCIAAPVTAHTRHERIFQGQIAYRHAGRTWKEIVAAKIFNQSEHMRRAGRDDWAEMRNLSRKVRNGDVGNLEAVAAARYFDSLGIVRTTQRDEINPMPNPALNYAYAFVRSATARSLVAHGMQCALGVHHDNMRNPYCLADDMMEPFRPLVDEAVLELPDLLCRQWRHIKMETPVKELLARIVYRDVKMGSETVPMMLAIDRSCAALARIYSGEETTLELPRFPE